MFVDLPDQLILYTAGAFLLGWLLSSIKSRLGTRHRARKRDPRDDRIRELEAELVITEQQSKLERMQSDLKDSVLKTRELRGELTQRATENVHAEAKIREVETELSVAQASTDLIATGVLDYSLAPDKEEGGDSANEDVQAEVGKTAN
jgi:hypothetical protein